MGLISGQGTRILVAAGLAKKIVIIKMKFKLETPLRDGPVLNKLSNQKN